MLWGWIQVTQSSIFAVGNSRLGAVPILSLSGKYLVNNGLGDMKCDKLLPGGGMGRVKCIDCQWSVLAGCMEGTKKNFIQCLSEMSANQRKKEIKRLNA